VSGKTTRVITVLFERDSAVRDVLHHVLPPLATEFGYQVFFESSPSADFFPADDRLGVVDLKVQHPRARVGILDPKLSGWRGLANAANADFLVVSSLEQQL